MAAGPGVFVQWLTYDGADNQCLVAVAPRKEQLPTRPIWSLHARLHAPCAPLLLRTHEPAQLWLLGEAEPPEKRGRLIAFSQRTLAHVSLNQLRTAGLASPPRGWIVCAALGLVLAIGAQLRRRRGQQVLAALAHSRQGTRLDTGRIEFLDDTPAADSPPDGDVAAGPVVVLSGALHPGDYRTQPAFLPGVIVPGTRAELELGATSYLCDQAAMSLSLLVLTCTPLLLCVSILR